MKKTNTFARTVHDLGLAAWFGGTLMGAVGLNEAASAADDPTERTRIVNAGWAKWTPANFAAIAAYLAGSAAITFGNKGRMAAQHGVGRSSAVKTGLTAMTLAATAYSRVLGQRVMAAGAVPVKNGTTPDDKTPEDVARAQRQLKLLQWAIPAHVGALIALTSRMGEQQRPMQVAKGVARRVRKAA